MQNNMRRVLLITFFIATLMLAFCGCKNEGIKDDAGSGESWDYNDLWQAMKLVGAEYKSVGDWTISDENNSFIYKTVKPEKSVFTIYVNPVATDDIIDDYVNLALTIDRVFTENTDYKKYSKKEDPFFIDFVCHDEIILSMNLDGGNDGDTLKKDILESMKDIREEVSEDLEKFHDFVASYECINKDDDGNYYFILDSSNVTQSLTQIEAYVDTINSHNPIGSNECSHYVGSMRSMGYIDGFYTIYLDEYGGDTIKIGMPGDMRSDIEFARDSMYLLDTVYYYLVGVGKYNDVAEGYEFYYLVNNPNRDPQMMMSIKKVAGKSHDDIINVAYKLYDEIYSKHEKYGIEAWSDLNFDGNYIDPEDDQYEYYINAYIPMDKHLEPEEFRELYLEGTERYPVGYFELPDDC